MMKMSTLFLLAGCLQLTANSYAQGITLSLNNAILSTAFEEIQHQTPYRFVYTREQVAAASKISINVQNASIEKVLELCFKDQPLSYLIDEKYIVVSVKDVKTVVVLATDNEVRGRVANEKDEPIAGASVRIKSNGRGISTNDKGGFVLSDVPAGSTILVSSIGYESTEVLIGNNRFLNIHLQTVVSDLEEMVIKGYYTTSKRVSTGSVSKLSEKEIVQQPVSNVLGAMEGRLAGVYIQQTSGVAGGGYNIQIRGQNSIASGNNPLYIIDGVPFVATSLSAPIAAASILTGSGASPLNMINPADIESIEVLKDADATAIYGSRGANGVILITTKKGKEGLTVFDANLREGVGLVTHRIPLLNTQQYLSLRREAFANDNRNMTNYNAPDFLQWDTTRYTDWQKVLFGKKSHTSIAQINLSGGNKATQFLFGGGYYRETSVFPGDFTDQKASFHNSLNHTTANGRLSINFLLNYVYESNHLPGSDLTNLAYSLPPDAPALYDSTRHLNWANSTWTNPLSYLNRTYEASSTNLIGNSIITYEIIKNVKLKVSLGYNTLNRSEKMLTPSTYYDPGFGLTPEYATASFNTASVKSWIIEPQLNWQKKTVVGTIDVLAGSTVLRQNTEGLVQNGTGYASDNLISNPQAASFLVIQNYSAALYKYAAVFGRLNYNLNQTYLLNFTARRDGSSRFGPGKQFANFGAVGAAWIFTNQKLFSKHIGFIDFGKLKASYGTSGNDQIGDYAFLDTYATTGTYQGTGGLTPNALYNPAFAWELNRKLEFGIDLGFLKNRIFTGIEYYRNRSSNQLVGYALPPTTGFNSIEANLPAVVQNSGIEMELHSLNLKNTKLTWSTSINISFPRNKLLAFPNLQGSTYADSYVIGQPLNISKGYFYTGVNPGTGVFGFRDLDGDGAITDADRQAILFFGQNYFGGIQNSLIYKNFRLDFLIQYVDQKGYNYWPNLFARPGLMKNEPVIVLDHWKNKGDNALVQMYTTGTNDAAVTAFSNFLQSNGIVTDASFARLKNVELSYQFPKGWTKNKIQSGRVYIQGQNLFTLTKYKGLDPESQGSYLPPLFILVAGLQLSIK